MVESFCNFILRRRVPVLAILALLTGFMLWQAKQVKVESRTIDLFPSTHPYVETFTKYADIFGGASRVVLQVEVKEGTIFNRQTLEKVQRITKAIEFLPAVSNYQVMSIAQRKAKNQVHDAEGMRSIPVMWPNVPQTPEEIAHVRDDILSNPLLYGKFVSLDEKAALIVAGFFENRLEPKGLYRDLHALIEKESDANTSIEVIGRPVMVGNILNESPRLALIIAITSFSMLMVLVLYYRNLVGILVPTAAALMAAVMGFGFLGLMKENFDPLVLVIPFIITARAISHSVQVVSRFIDELQNTNNNRLDAAFRTSTALFKPGVLAIVTDVVGILLIYLAPIPLMQKLALMGAFWFTSIFLGGMVLSPILMSMLPVPKPKKLHVAKQGLVDAVLGHVAVWCTGRARYWIFAITVLTMGVGVVFANDLVVGDVHPGTPMLWPDSEYNQSTDRIAERFTNTEEVTVVVEGATRDAIKNPQVLATIEAFQRHMEELPEVGATLSIIDVLPRVISVLHGSDPKWELVPDSKEQAGFFLEMMYTTGDPGDLTRFITPDSQNANITMYLRDHKGTTLRSVIARARDFIDKHPLQGAKFRMAGGYGGLLAAINEEVAVFDAKITLASFAAVFLCCVLAFRSVLAGFFFLIPLIGSNYMTYALMGAQQIGLDVNALPVVALGCGLGVDYGLYVTEAVKESFEAGSTVEEAVIWGLRSAGKGVIITAITMTLGLAFWRFSFLRFQAEMGMLLLFWMTVSMLGGLVLLPGLLVQFRPAFVFGKGPRVDARPLESAVA